jgi:hypothetical protein
MKKTALLLLLVFSMVQAAPAVCSLFQETTVFFMVDEEKSEENPDNDKKGKKDITLLALSGLFAAGELNTNLHQAENIRCFPCLEQLTPPPNC